MTCSAEGYETSFGRRVRLRRNCDGQIIVSGLEDFGVAERKYSQAGIREACDQCPSIPTMPEEPEYIDLTGNITINIASQGFGAVVSSGGDNMRDVRNSITLPYNYRAYFEAVPDSGYEFVKWTGSGGESFQNPIEILVIEPGSITAVFQRVDAPLPPQYEHQQPQGPCPRGEKYPRADLFGVKWGTCDEGYIYSADYESCVCKGSAAEREQPIGPGTNISQIPEKLTTENWLTIGIVGVIIISLLRR